MVLQAAAREAVLANTLMLPAGRTPHYGSFSPLLGGTEDYIAVKSKFAVYVAHTAGRYQKRRFRKALCPIVERCAELVREPRRPAASYSPC